MNTIDNLKVINTHDIWVFMTDTMCRVGNADYQKLLHKFSQICQVNLICRELLCLFCII